MDLTFISITFIFLVFLIIAFYLDVLKLSTPLVLIYLIFCFSYVMKKEIKVDTSIVESDIITDDHINKTPKAIEKPTHEKKNIELQNKQIFDVSKPIVSLNPKPIVIDSNLLIQKDKDNSLEIKTDSSKENSYIKVENIEKPTESLKLKEIMICRGVYKRNPIKPGFNFTNNVDSLFCYTKISNSGNKQEIKHLWYFNEKLVTSVTYNIKTSYNYRSWSKKTILPNQIGQWRVDIIDSKEKILGSRKFKISKLNDAF